MRLKILLLAMIVVTTTLNADECSKCDCAHFPWKTTCKSCCSLRLFNNSSNEELSRYLALDEESLHKLSELKQKNNEGKISSLEELKSALGSVKFDEIDAEIKDLNKAQVAYLVASPSHKAAVEKKNIKDAAKDSSPK